MELVHPSNPVRLSTPIEVSQSWGSATGYLTSLESGLPANYLGEFIADVSAVLQKLSFEYGASRVAVLKAMHVDEGERGKGRGNGMLREFIGSARGADILLIADAHEGQVAGFDLVTWYEGWGFERVCETGAGPLMILSQ